MPAASLVTSINSRIMHRYADRVLEVTNGNPRVNAAFGNVVNRRHPPTSLLRPVGRGHINSH